MRTMALMLAVIAAIAAPPDSGLEWGAVSSGVRLGIGLTPSSLRLVFENAAAEEVEIPLGGTTVKGPLYNLLFRIKSPAGEESSLFDFSGPTGTHMKVQPLVARLARGQKYEVRIPLDKLVFLDHGKNRALPELLAAHYSVRAILDTTGDPREVHTFAIWAGNVSSGLLKK